MKLVHTLALAAFAATAAVPAMAQHATHTTVERVHGPLKILPHHNRKICKVRWVNHRRVKKCWYH
jgi:hypothetical protein